MCPWASSRNFCDPDRSRKRDRTYTCLFEWPHWEEFLKVAQEVIKGQRGKDPDLARYVAERVVLRTKDVRQAIQVTKLCDSPEEVDRFEGGA